MYFPKRKRAEKPLTQREVSRLFHSDLDTRVLKLYQKADLLGLASSPFRFMLVLLFVHLAEHDITRAELIEATALKDNQVESALRSLVDKGLVENGSSHPTKAFYRTTGKAIRVLNSGRGHQTA